MMRRTLLSLLFILPSLAAAEDFSATLNWSKHVKLSTDLSGKVASLNVRPGDNVSKGDSLLTLDSRRYRAQLQQARAEQNRLSLEQEEAQREYERAEELYDRTVISERDLQLAEIALSQANSALAAAKAQVTQAQIDLEYSQLIAPFNGVVTAVHTHTGETVNNRLHSTPLLEIASKDSMLASAYVAEDAMLKLTPQQAMNVTVQGKRYPATLIYIANQINDQNQWEIRARFNTDGDTLRAGQSATLSSQ